MKIDSWEQFKGHVDYISGVNFVELDSPSLGIVQAVSVLTNEVDRLRNLLQFLAKVAFDAHVLTATEFAEMTK